MHSIVFRNCRSNLNSDLLQHLHSFIEVFSNSNLSSLVDSKFTMLFHTKKKYLHNLIRSCRVVALVSCLPRILYSNFEQADLDPQLQVQYAYNILKNNLNVPTH